MKLSQFKVTNFRNVRDSEWIQVNDITAFVGQNEAGKSNLFDALKVVNSFFANDKYDIDEDWPVDDWPGKDSHAVVCEADFVISDKDEIRDLMDKCFRHPESSGEGEEDSEERDEENSEDEDDEGSEDDGSADEAVPSPTPPVVKPPKKVTIRARRRYDGDTEFSFSQTIQGFDEAAASAWARANVPKFVYIHEYELSGHQTELDELAEKKRQHGDDWSKLGHEDQTILIILDLAKIDIDEFLQKGQTPAGRTTRAFDRRSASAYLSSQFQKLWSQKEVEFDIDIDGPTLNIFAKDVGANMPVRLHRRSTGFRWHVSFAWKFTHASKGQYKNCILLLEEPGIHLHFDGQRDVLNVFENLSPDNTILYTTHLSSMVDLANPERVRIVEIQDRHAKLIHGVVSSQRAPMAVIEGSLGLTGQMCGLLGNRCTLIVEGGDDALILQKLSGVMAASDKTCLSDRIYPWPADGAPNTPMYAAFAIGQKWNAAVLLDTDKAGWDAKAKIQKLYLDKLAEEDQKRFRILMIEQSAGIGKTDAAIEDLFPDQFYLDCVNRAYGFNISLDDLPKDGSTMITKRIESVIVNNHGRSKLDKRLVMTELLSEFDGWKSAEDLPNGVADRAEKLFSAINRAFELQ